MMQKYCSGKDAEYLVRHVEWTLKEVISYLFLTIEQIDVLDIHVAVQRSLKEQGTESCNMETSLLFQLLR